MILYFTGTGNSKFAAEYIGSVIGEEPVSINEFMKKGECPEFHSDSPYIITAPVYAWRMPHVVEDFLKRCSFSGSRDMYFVLTCGDSIGNAGAYAETLCREKGMQYKGMADVAMPENYITMFSAPPEEEEKLIMEKARCRLKSVAETIAQGECLMQKSPKAKALSAIVNPVFYKLFVHDRAFRAEESCTGCGFCERICPLQNIKLKDGKPVWGGECTQCMACICGCSAEAIEYGKKSAGKRRYWCEPFDK